MAIKIIESFDGEQFVEKQQIFDYVVKIIDRNPKYQEHVRDKLIEECTDEYLTYNKAFRFVNEIMQDWDWIDRLGLKKRAEKLRHRLVVNREKVLVYKTKIENLMKTSGIDLFVMDELDLEKTKSLVRSANGNPALVKEIDCENFLVMGQTQDNGKIFGYGMKETET